VDKVIGIGIIWYPHLAPRWDKPTLRATWVYSLIKTGFRPNYWVFNIKCGMAGGYFEGEPFGSPSSFHKIIPQTKKVLDKTNLFFIFMT